MARLVKGSTDILQPINLIPNSDFSRHGGQPTTLTIPQLDSSHNNIEICSHFILNANGGSYSNVNITRNIYAVNSASHNSMAISAKVNTHGSYSREFSIIFFLQVKF